MSNAALLYGKETGNKQVETTESMKYYTMSLDSINKRLQDPVEGFSEGVIGAVLGFACYDVKSPREVCKIDAKHVIAHRGRLPMIQYAPRWLGEDYQIARWNANTAISSCTTAYDLLVCTV
jgi:hypothetical protein